jgi:4-alpha-glucanotransferase
MIKSIYLLLVGASVAAFDPIDHRSQFQTGSPIQRSTASPIAPTTTPDRAKFLMVRRKLANTSPSNELRANMEMGARVEMRGLSGFEVGSRHGIILAAVCGRTDHSDMTTPKTRPNRASGILLHPTSLPGLGSGDLGAAAYAWIDALARAKQRWWQILPLNPTGYGDSPYQSFSAFAGNPMLVSPEQLAKEGLIRADDYRQAQFPADRVDYGNVIPFRDGLLDRAFEQFQRQGTPSLKGEFERFCQGQAWWLNDYALFMAIKEKQGGASWQEWPEAIRLRRTEALNDAQRELGPQAARHQFRQFLFFRQWSQLRGYAHGKGIKIIGDVPIFVAGDSADVWAHPEKFLMDAQRRQTVMAGVPPDYFSATGQLWGNPIYDWEAARRGGYVWWVERMRATLALVDVVRIDHFRGFAAAWHVPAGSATAQKGAWVPGPGMDLFAKLRSALGALPLIAEDLGLITPDVEKLRDSLGLPGMRVLQFAFGGDAENSYLPHNYKQATVAYTGTHDNDTTRGWFATRPEKEADHVRRYLGRDGSDIAWDLIRLGWSSVADLAVAPLQDVLNLGSEARMNTPGKPDGNWTWRIPEGALREEVLARLAEMTVLYGRN